MEDNKNHVANNFEKEKCSADLDEALDVAGVGWFNFKYCLILAMLLISAIMELLGSSLILPAAVCDLEMTDSQRGLVISIPYIGILLTSYPWGYLVDTRGRKKMLVYSSMGAGVFVMLAGLMPNLISYAIFKFLGALCLACPSSATYTFIGEMLPSKYRDVFLSVLNSTQIAGSALVPLLAWAILPLDFRVNFGLYIFRPWRLLNMIYASFFIVFAALLACSPESPKFLVSQDKFDEALKVLQNMYAGNKGKKPEEYPIKQLLAPPNGRIKGNFLTSLRIQTVPLLKWSYLKWILLNGFLFFGVFVITNGLNVWVPDVLNRVLTGGGADKTACEIILDGLNQTSTQPADVKCEDSIDNIVFIISFASRFCCAVIALMASATVRYIGKKRLIITSFFYIGLTCTAVNLIKKDIVFAILLSSTTIVVLSVGPINAYAVEIFPTHLRGMAVSLAMMLGRTGSIFGANVTGLMINNACEIMFYSFGGLLFLCSALAFLLPRLTPQSHPVKGNGAL